MQPKVAVIWVNYNSSHIISIVKSSLKSLFEVNYPKQQYEIIIVDNASTDNSWKIVRELSLMYSNKYNVKAKFIRLTKNLMYTGGNNVGLHLISEDIKYVGFVNNDVIINTDSILLLTEYLTQNEMIGAVQGILFNNFRKTIINSYGLFIDNLLISHLIRKNIGKPLSVSFTHGAFSIYSINALKQCMFKDRRIFFQCAPAFYDDTYLGIRLWNLGFLSCAIPIDAGVHLHSATFKKLSFSREYNSFKSWIVKYGTVRTDQALIKLYFIRNFLKYWVLRLRSLRTTVRALKEGINCYDYVLRTIGGRMNLEKVPHIRLRPSEILRMIIGAERQVYSKFLDADYLLERACLTDLCPQ